MNLEIDRFELLAAIPWQVFRESGGLHWMLAGVGLGTLALRRSPRLLPHFLVGFLALLGGYLNLLTDEIRWASCLTMASGFVAGAVRPASALAWLPWIALPVPLGETLRSVVGASLPNLTAIFASCLVVVPAALGVVIGRFTRRAMACPSQS